MSTMTGRGPWVRLAEDSDNLSILLLGRSGSGKTYALYEIERNLASSGEAVLILNFHGTHDVLEKCQSTNWIDAYTEGIPLSFLSPVPQLGKRAEDLDDVAEAALEVFCRVSSLQVHQRAVLRKAIGCVLQRKCAIENEILAIGEELRKDEDDSAGAVYDKFYMLFTKGQLSEGRQLVESGKVTVLDLSGYSEQVQTFFAEMVLSCIWRYFHIWGQNAKKNLFIVCDEFQVLSLHRRGILNQILREGRKFHLALLLATQTLQDLEKGERAVLQQAATQLYFHPAPNEVKEIVKNLNVDKKDTFVKMLLNLQKGECIAQGRFEVGGVCVERPIKIKF